jgi:hypothetical protein
MESAGIFILFGERYFMRVSYFFIFTVFNRDFHKICKISGILKS